VSGKWASAFFHSELNDLTAEKEVNYKIDERVRSYAVPLLLLSESSRSSHD
jgi:hypothetical protein